MRSIEFKRRRAVAVVTGLLVLVGGGGVAYGVTSGSGNATCTPSPAVTQSDTDQSFDVHCSVPLPPPPVTATVTQTQTQTVTQTVTATPSTTTPAPTTSTTTPAPTTSTTTPSPTTTTVTPSPTTSTTTPATYSCVQTTAQGKCYYSAVPYITGANGDPYLNQNIWAGSSTYKQTLYGASPKDWYITASANTGWGGVNSYPNLGWNMTGTVDSKATTTSSWSTSINHDSTIAAWAAYDLWFNNWADEVMIQTDIAAPVWYNCTAVTTATFGGQPWHMCQFGSERVWKPGTDDSHLRNAATGSLDIKAILVWMEAHGYLKAGSTWTAGSYGFEVCDTHGITEKLAVTDFSWKS